MENQEFSKEFRKKINLEALAQPNISSRPLLTDTHSKQLYVCLQVLDEALHESHRLVLTHVDEEGNIPPLHVPFLADISGDFYTMASVIVRRPIVLGTRNSDGRQELLRVDGLKFVGISTVPPRKAAWDKSRLDKHADYQITTTGMIQYESYLTYEDQFDKKWVGPTTPAPKGHCFGDE